MKKLLLFISISLLFSLFSSAQAQSNQLVTNGNTVTAVNFPNTGCTFNWVNDTPGIGLAASGTGNIASFTAVNNTSNSITATITATPTAAGGFAYIANRNSNNVSVINTATNTVVTTIPVNVNPSGVAINPDGSKVYVANATSGNISVISTSTNAVVSTITVNNPYSLAISPDGNKLYVGSLGASTITVINISTNAIITTISIISNPYGICLSPDGSRLYVANAGSEDLTVINTSNNTIVKVIPVGIVPWGLCISPDGSLLYVANSSSNNIDVISTLTYTITATIYTGYLSGTISLCISPDGSTLYSANYSLNNVSVINTATNSVIANIPVGSGPYGLSISPDGNEIYAVNSGSNNVSVINAKSNTIISTVNVGSQPWSFGNFVLGAANCTSSPVTFSITVNPSPTIKASTVSGTISACAGTASANGNVQQFTVSGNDLTTDITVDAPINFEVSLSADSGYGNSVALAQTGGVVNNTTVYVRSAASAPAGSIAGNIELTSTGITTQSFVVTGKVNALPTVNKVSDQSVTNGSLTTAVNFTGTGNIFSWVNDTPRIGLAASGTGGIPVFTAVNTGSKPITATITVTPESSSEYAYINNSSDGTVSVINTVTNNIVATIPVGTTPVGVAVTPDGKYVYIENEDSNTISVISSATNKVIATIPVGSFARGDLSVSPDGSRLYFATFGGNNVLVINTSTNAIITTIPVGQLPLGVIVSPDDSKLYVGNFQDGTISIINTSTNTVVSSINLGLANGMPTAPLDVTISPDGSRLYAATQNPDQVCVINTVTDKVIALIPVGLAADAITISPDGSRLYVTSQYANTVSVINTATNTLITTISVSANPNGISVSPDGSQLYVTSPAETTVINTGTNTIKTTIVTSTSTHSTGNFITNTTSCPGLVISFNIIVNPIPPVPTITATGSLSAQTTIYGTASSSTSFTVSGSGLTAGILVTPLPGFEVSTDNVNFSSTVTGSISNSTTVYVRLASTTAVGNYSGNIVLSSTGAGNVNVVMPNSTVNPAPLTIIAANIDKTYGTALVGKTGSTAFTLTGLQNNETVGTATIGYGTGAVADATPGNYSGSVVASAATGGTFTASNYTITYIDGDITVDAAPLTITANNLTKVYGTANPAFTVIYSGFVNNESAEQLTTLPQVSTIANTASPVGTYPITVSGASSPDYTFTYVNGVLTIDPPTLIIPNAFTPNGDGINDTWNIKYLENYPNCLVDIYNRYGERLYSSVGYPIPWDGKYKGAILPTGTYYYVINTKSNLKTFSGYVTIIR